MQRSCVVKNDTKIWEFGGQEVESKAETLSVNNVLAEGMYFLNKSSPSFWTFHCPNSSCDLGTRSQFLNTFYTIL